MLLVAKQFGCRQEAAQPSEEVAAIGRCDLRQLYGLLALQPDPLLKKLFMNGDNSIGVQDSREC